MHPALKISFDELIMGIEAERSAGFISRKENGDLVLYNYNQSCTYRRHWTPSTLIARGLVVVPKEKKIVALPFPKFFNYGELGSPSLNVNLDGSLLTEKLDGSLGIIFFYHEWHVVTRGSFDSSQSKWAHAWLKRNGILTKLIPGVTYLTEIIYEENRIVVSYDFERVTLLGAYSEHGEEILGLAELNSGLDIVELHKVASLDELNRICLNLPSTREGFVLRQPNGERIKFKGAAYCAAHKAKVGCTPQTVWQMMRDCENLSLFREILPEEFYEDFDRMVKDLENALNVTKKRIKQLANDTIELTNKEIGQSNRSSEEKSLIFLCRKPEYEVELEKKGRIRTALFNIFHPK